MGYVKGLYVKGPYVKVLVLTQNNLVMFGVKPKFLIQHRVNVKGEKGTFRR